MNFEDFSLSKETMKSISEIGFEEPTPIQVSAIPLILNNCDIVELISKYIFEKKE
jgi:ATP-dependent RNA helicase DeaD